MSHDAAEENGEQLYEAEPQTQEEELYQNPEETTAAAGGELVTHFNVMEYGKKQMFGIYARCITY